MYSHCRSSLLVLLFILGSGGSAVAQAVDGDAFHGSTEQYMLSGEAGMFLPQTLAPSTHTQSVFAGVVGGYDSAKRSGVVEGNAEVALFGALAARIGVLNTGAPNRLRPTAGLRVQALEREHDSVDLSFGAFYRPEGFTEGEGEVEVVTAFGMRFQRWGIFTNLVYGQDPEGAERDGELRAAVLRTITPKLELGFDARLRIDLHSAPGVRRKEGGEYDVIAGPTTSYALGGVVVLAQAGLTAVDRTGFTPGAVGLAGIAGVF